MLFRSAIDRGLKPHWNQTKDYNICISRFYAKSIVLRSEIKDWRNWNQVNMSEWSQHYKDPTKRVGLIQSRLLYHIIECNVLSPWYSWKNGILALKNKHSLFYIIRLSFIVCLFLNIYIVNKYIFRLCITHPDLDCLGRNQDNVSEWCDISIWGLLFLWASTIQIWLSVLV